jgi:hypothetical protein
VRESLQRIGAAGAFENTWIRYDRLRFARLCLYLRARGPDANIGYSLLLFHLNAVEVAGATTGKWSDLHDLIETITARKP